MKVYEDQLIVVTGGAGFIGSGLVRFLNDQGVDNLVLVDDLGQTEKWKNLVGKKFREIIPKGQLFSWLEGKEALIEAFIHLGACSDTMETNASYLLENNYRYSIRLAEYALRNRQRFLYASSAATYGNGSQGFTDDPERIYAGEPLNMYAFSKQLFDQWVVSEGLLDQVVGLKYFNVFGPNEAHKGRMASAITRMVPQILKGAPVTLFKSSDPQKFADGEQQRDFIYVKDAVRMTYAFLINDAVGIYNVGSGQPSTWKELATAVFHALDQPVQIEYIDMPAELVSKYQNYSCADMRRTRGCLKELGDCRPLAEAVSDYVRNHLMLGKGW